MFLFKMIITTKDQSIKFIPSGEKYLKLNKILFHHTVFKNEDTIILSSDEDSAITINPGYTTIENFYNSFKLIDSNFEYSISGLTVFYKFSIDVIMIVNNEFTNPLAFIPFKRYSKIIKINYKFVDFKLEEINEAYDNNTKLLTRLAITPNYRLNSTISEILNKKIRLTDNSINKSNLSIYINKEKINGFASVEFTVVNNC